MLRAAVVDVPLIIRHPDHYAQNARDTTGERGELGHHGETVLIGTLDGRFFSKISKIRLYSSAHDDGLTNP
jgi:hypothetical protein